MVTCDSLVPVHRRELQSHEVPGRTVTFVALGPWVLRPEHHVQRIN